MMMTGDGMSPLPVFPAGQTGPGNRIRNKKGCPAMTQNGDSHVSTAPDLRGVNAFLVAVAVVLVALVGAAVVWGPVVLTFAALAAVPLVFAFFIAIALP